MQEFTNDTGRASIGQKEDLKHEKQGTTLQLVSHRTPELRNPLLILLEKMYGYVIMSTMMSLSNKLGWKSREAVELHTQKTESEVRGGNSTH